MTTEKYLQQTKFKNTVEGASDIFCMGFAKLPFLDFLALGSLFLPSVALMESVLWQGLPS